MKKIIFLYASLLCLAALFFATVSAFSQSTLSNGLNACYSFNGNSNDAINGLNGIDSNVTFVVGKNGNANGAYQFSGNATSMVLLPDTNLLKAQVLSISLWTMPMDSNATEFILFAKNTANGNFEGFDLVTNFDKFQFGKHNVDSNKYADVVSVSNIKYNHWNHVCITASTDSMSIYVNGLKEATVWAAFPFSYEAGKYVVVGNTNENFLPFHGSVDNLRFYNRALTSTEVNDLFTLDPTCVTVPSGIVTADNKSSILISPNPAADMITINSETTNAEINIFSIDGKNIYTGIVNNIKQNIDVSSFENGLYIIELKAEGKVNRSKFIKE